MKNDQSNNSNNSNRWLIILLSLLYVAIVGLVIGLIVVRFNSPVDDYSDADEKTTAYNELSKEALNIVDATNVCGGIRNQYINEGYEYEDAVADMENALNDSVDPSFRVSLASCYADFVNNYGNNADFAINILNRVENDLDSIDSGIAVRYYSIALLITKDNEELHNYYLEKSNKYEKMGGVVDED